MVSVRKTDAEQHANTSPHKSVNNNTSKSVIRNTYGLGGDSGSNLQHTSTSSSSSTSKYPASSSATLPAEFSGKQGKHAKLVSTYSAHVTTAGAAGGSSGGSSSSQTTGGSDRSAKLHAKLKQSLSSHSSPSLSPAAGGGTSSSFAPSPHPSHHHPQHQQVIQVVSAGGGKVQHIARSVSPNREYPLLWSTRQNFHTDHFHFPEKEVAFGQQLSQQLQKVKLEQYPNVSATPQQGTASSHPALQQQQQTAGNQSHQHVSGTKSSAGGFSAAFSNLLKRDTNTSSSFHAGSTHSSHQGISLLGAGGGGGIHSDMPKDKKKGEEFDCK